MNFQEEIESYLFRVLYQLIMFHAYFVTNYADQLHQNMDEKISKIIDIDNYTSSFNVLNVQQSGFCASITAWLGTSKESKFYLCLSFPSISNQGG